jgi:ankyrin repeat protein
MRHLGLWVSLGALVAAWSSLITAQSSPSRLYDAIRTNNRAGLRAMVHGAADANAKDDGGKTPLMYAAAVGSIDAVKFLIDKGADVNAQNESGLTALMLAATDLPKVRLLVDRGANVNATTKLGRTALFLAAMSDDSAAIVRLLVTKGADLKATDMFRNTMLNAAAAGNDTETIHLVIDAGVDVNAAATTGLTPLMLAAGQSNIRAVKLMLAKGVRVDAQAVQDRIKMIQTAGFPVDILYERMDIRVPEIVAYQLAGLAAVGYPPDPMTDAMASHIAASQNADGAWHIPFGVQQRPGGEDGDIFRDALGIRSLKAYGPPGRAPEMQARIAKARRWLLQAKAVTAEDRNMQLLGLDWAGASGNTLKQLAKAILAEQQADGGWRQREGLGSDAYATGET